MEEPGQTNIETKLNEIGEKVDRILKSADAPITKKALMSKKHEKKLFDVDINLNISTDGQTIVKGLTATSKTDVKK